MNEFINFKKLVRDKVFISSDFNSKIPFKYVIIDDFFKQEQAEAIYKSYPSLAKGMWDGTTYIDQKNKFQKTSFEHGSIFNLVFEELNSEKFIEFIQEITKIKEQIIGDKSLFGGGLHQSTNGAFLNVHVDYNIHPTTKFHRRLNILIYMNKDWKEEYNGYLELWDLRNSNRKLIDFISPIFNRCVIFETNEISFHGHPKPLMTPENICRKSLAAYYYTKTREFEKSVAEHNTIYVNVEGISGYFKKIQSGFSALVERLLK